MKRGCFFCLEDSGAEVLENQRGEQVGVSVSRIMTVTVRVIMPAYTLFAVMMIDGTLGLCIPAKRESLMHLSQLLLYPALFCLTAGIFIGAVWANLSWGRYWGWDPKETWALITMLVYALPVHWPVISRKLKVESRKSKGESQKQAIYYHICTIVAFLFVLFTYFGVNRLPGGLHSYA